jgi:hypothetical protein
MAHRPLILFATSVFGRSPDTTFACRQGCEFTTDRRRLREADAVVFHLPSANNLRRARKYPGQLWVAWSMESRVSYPLLADAAAMRHFDIVMSYERSADIWCSYLPHGTEFEEAFRNPPPPKTDTAPAVLFQSARHDLCGRNLFLRDLIRFMRIDSYGAFLKTRDLDVPDVGHATKVQVIGRYKFCLAFENSIAPDYVTEKFFEPLLAGSVPVYRGAPNVEEFAPGENCFVDASRFDGPRALAEYLNHLSTDTAAYRELHAWRERPLRGAFLEKLAPMQEDTFCTLCALVHARHPRSWWARLAWASRPLARRQPA